MEMRNREHKKEYDSMPAEYECNKCHTIFFYSDEHSGAQCPKCKSSEGFTVRKRELSGNIVNLEQDEWSEYGT